MPCPSLQRICIEVLAWSADTTPFFQLQKRRMQLLPEDAANTLAQLLLHFQRLRSPTQLDAFRDCLTALTITPASGLHLDAEWLAHIASLRELRSLAIRDMSRLRDKAMSPLTAAAARLAHLDLSGCSGLTSRSLVVLGQLTSLQSLVCTGTSIRPPVLAQLSALQHLTRLHLGGCEVTDVDIIQHASAFTALRDLDLWGCAAGDAAARHITQHLRGLSRLSMAWSHVAAALPLPSSLTWLDLSHCRLTGPFRDAEFVAAAKVQQLRALVLVQVEVDPMGCELLETLIRSSASTLQVLDLTRATLGAQLPLLLALEAAGQLSALSLSGTQLVDDNLPALAACSSLKTLNLSLNPDITAAGLGAALPGFAAQLQRLDLRGTGVSNTVLPVLRQLPQQQQLVLADTGISWEAKAAEGAGAEPDAAAAAAAARQAVAATAQCRSPGTPAAGWPRLQVLDVTNTQLSDAGCLQLVAEMSAAAATGTGPGLLVLHVGSASSKPGRKALMALGQLTTLQQLTLTQGWALSDRDMRHLHPLQQLQQLHVNGADPWLLSDAALLQMPEQLPELRSLTRDGRQLLLDAVQTAAAAPASPAGSSSHPGRAAFEPVRPGWQADSSNAAAGSCLRSMWPAGPLPDEAAQQGQTIMSPWLQQRAAQGPASKQPPTILQHRDRRLGSSDGTVYQRLSAYDERLKYNSEELLALREDAVRQQSCSVVEHAPAGAGLDAGSPCLSSLPPAEIQQHRTAGKW